MKKCIIGKKIGMTQLFDENGNIVPVTVVEAGPCVVVQRKTTESDGYEAVQIGFGAVSDKKLTKALKGHFAKADVAAKRVLREFRLEDLSAIAVGDIIKADTFAPGDKVDVCGTSKGKATPAPSSAGTTTASRIPTVPALSTATPAPTAPAPAPAGSSRASACRATWASSG